MSSTPPVLPALDDARIAELRELVEAVRDAEHKYQTVPSVEMGYRRRELNEARLAFFRVCDGAELLGIFDELTSLRASQRDNDWMPDVLNMVHERLAVFLGEESMRGTPPMFYDDAITAVARKVAMGELPDESYPDGSLLRRLQASEAANAELLTELLSLRASQEEGARTIATLQNDAERYRRINTPEIHEFVEAVENEALHQRDRWGASSDGGKTDADWFWLIGYLAGKALHNPPKDDMPPVDARLHRIITVAAAAANWHAATLGAYADMRPGIDAPAASLPSVEVGK